MYIMVLTDKKPEYLAPNEIWIQYFSQAIECVNTKGLPTEMKVGESLGFDLFGNPLPTASDFLNYMKKKVADGEWTQNHVIKINHID